VQLRSPHSSVHHSENMTIPLRCSSIFDKYL